MQSLHDTRTKHTLLIQFNSTQRALRIHKIPHYVHAYYRPRIFHFNPFIGHHKGAKNDVQLQLLAKHS